MGAGFWWALGLAAASAAIAIRILRIMGVLKKASGTTGPSW